jgi:hypothetical protein
MAGGLSRAGADKTTDNGVLLGLLKFGNHEQNDRTQLRQMDGKYFPKPAIVDVLVFMPQHVSNSDDRAPWRTEYRAVSSAGNAFAASETICTARSAARRSMKLSRYWSKLTPRIAAVTPSISSRM